MTTSMKLITSRSRDELQNGFMCGILRVGEILKCSSLIQSSYDMQVSTTGIRPYSWYIMLLRVNGATPSSSLELREMNFDPILSSISKSFFYPGGAVLTEIQFQHIHLGINHADQSTEGFIGNLRNLKIFNSYIGNQDLKQAQFTYLNQNDNYFRLQIMLSSLAEITNTASYTGDSEVIGPSKVLNMVKDDTAVFQCWQPRNDQIVSSNIDLNGNVPASTSNIFDGVTCVDKAEKLQFTSASSFATLPVTNVTTPILAFTLELWFKPQVIQNGEVNLVTVQNSDAKGAQSIVVKLEKNNSLACYTNFSQPGRQAIFLKDYSIYNLQWNHISCSFDPASYEQMRSVLFVAGMNYTYTRQVPGVFNLSQAFNILLNSDPISIKGFKSVMMTEVRFWTSVRSREQILNSRLHQVDYLNAPTLKSYYKLLSGSLDKNSNPIEFDQIDFQGKMSLSNPSGVSWLPSTDIVFCPVGFFKGQQVSNGEVEKVCYREGIIYLSLSVFKNNQNQYVITSNYSEFRNQFVRSQVSSLYNFTWNLESSSVPKGSNQTTIFNSALNPQIQKSELIFPVSLFSDTSVKFILSATVLDKRNWQNSSQALVTFKPLQCASIFDRATLQPQILLDLDFNRGSRDVVFSYNYTECIDYKLDPNSLIAYLEVDGVTNQQSVDINATSRTLTLRASLQSGIPINQYFSVRLRAVWKNVKQASDFAEYFMIFNARFIQKINFSLTPNQLIMYKDNAGLSIKHSFSLINIDAISPERGYSVRWVCPGFLNQICSNITGDLSITYEQFKASGLRFFEPQTYTFVATTNFLSGDGLTTQNRTVNVNWWDYYVSGSIKVLNIGNYSIYTSVVTAQLDYAGLEEKDSLIKWSVSPPLPSTSCYLSDQTSKTLLINQTCLQVKTPYNFSAQIFCVPYNNSLIWSGFNNSLVIPRQPYNGTLKCTPSTARAILDLVTCTASGWIVDTGTPLYQFYLYADTYQDLVPIGNLTNSTSISLYLPLNSQILLKVADSLGQSAPLVTVSLNMSLDLPPQDLMNIINTQIGKAYISKSQNSSASMKSLWWMTAAIQQVSSNQSYLQSTMLYYLDLLSYQTQNLVLQGDDLYQFRFYVTSLMPFIFGQIDQFSDKKLNFYKVYQDMMRQAVISDEGMMRYLFDERQNVTHYLLNVQSQFFALVPDQLPKSVKYDRNRQRRMLQSSLTDFELALITNLTIGARSFLETYERFISSHLNASQSYSFNTSMYNLSIIKYSSQEQKSKTFQLEDQSGFKYQFPLSTSGLPTSAQSLSVITYAINPFFEQKLDINQTFSSPFILYQAYRDVNGQFLDQSYVQNSVIIAYPHNYTQLLFLPIPSVCSYKAFGDVSWGNQTCQTIYNRDMSTVICQCKYSNYYTLIDDTLERPLILPLVSLTIKNGLALFTFLFVFLYFIVGTIYAYNKDLQDFRYIHEQDEAQGLETESDDMINLISLAFKRKVFFLDFSEEYSFLTLFRLYLMLLHPIFSLKYKLDPHLSRFYRFLLLFTRLNINFGLSFLILRNLPNTSSSQSSSAQTQDIITLVIFILLASLLYAPLPTSTLLSCFRSVFYLLKPKPVSKSAPAVTSEEGGDLDSQRTEFDREIEERLSNVEVDTNIPIKLLFLLNAMKLEKIMAEEEAGASYCSGQTKTVGMKLLELDQEYAREKESKREKGSALAKQVAQSERGHLNTQASLRNNVTELPMMIAGTSRMQNVTAQNLTSLSATHIQNERLQSEAGPDQGLRRHLNQTPQFEADTISISFTKQLNNGNATSGRVGGTIENLGHDSDEENANARNKRLNLSKKHLKQYDEDLQFEGGEHSHIGLTVHPQGSNNPSTQQNRNHTQEAEEEESSIDTNLFLDEKKELIEFSNVYLRLLGNFLFFGINITIYAVMVALFIKEKYYNEDNNFMWVIGFFASQVFGLCFVSPLCLILLAAIVSKWFKFQKVFLTRFFREGLYIYEDYQFVVKFAKTKIS